MEMEEETEQEDIPRCNTNGVNTLDTSKQDNDRCENAATRSNMKTHDNTTG